MFHKIKKVEAQSNLILKIEFENNTIKYYDVKNVMNKYEEFNILKNKSIFENVRVDVGGYAVIWNETLDLDCEELFQNGYEK